MRRLRQAIGRLDNVRWKVVLWKMLITFGEGVIATLTAEAMVDLDASLINAALLGGLAAAASFLYNVASQLWKGSGAYIEPEQGAVLVTGRDLNVEVKNPDV
jgi:hypothetical protein